VEAIHTAPLSYVLDNGLRVVIAEDHSTSLVGVVLMYGAGSAQQPPGTLGFAHLFEHLQFAGSRHIDADTQRVVFDSFGGNENARTLQDYLELYGIAPSDELPSVLWLYSDRMGFLTQGLTEKSLRAAKDVVIAERIERIENSPRGLATEMLFRAVFPKPNPYHDLVIGPAEEVERASLSDIAKFHAEYFQPSNAILVIAGDVQPASAQALIQKFFAPLVSKSPAPKYAIPAIPAPDAKVHVLPAETKARSILVGWQAPPALSDDEASLQLATVILGDPASGLLKKSLVVERRLASTASCSYWTMRAASMVLCSVQLRDGVDYSTVVSGVEEVAKGLGAIEVNADDVRRAFVQWHATMLRNQEELVSRARAFAVYTLYAGRPDYLGLDVSKHRAVSPAEIKGAAARYLAPNGAVFIVTEPKQAEVR